MTAQEAMKLLIRDLLPVFQSRAYKKNALTFYRREGENFGLVQFQKSRYSTAAKVEFTINLSVFSSELHRGLGEFVWVPSVGRVPTEPDCQLRQRIGSLLPEHQDKWWSIDPDTDRQALANELQTALEAHGFPFLERLVSDADLRDHWLARKELWHQHGLRLAILVRNLGPRELLPAIISQVRAGASRSPGFLSAIEKFEASLS